MLANIILGLFRPESQVLIIIRLTGIVLCFIYALRYFANDHMLHYALFTTIIADLILAVNHTAELGVLVFFIAQLFHAWRLLPPQQHPKLYLFIVIAAVSLTLSILLPILPFMYVISAFYVVAILGNLYASYLWHRRSPQNPQALYALLGFSLFLCCDICIAVSYLSFINIFSSFFYLPANFFGWFFYYPSQILVSNSSKCDKMSSKGR